MFHFDFFLCTYMYFFMLVSICESIAVLTSGGKSISNLFQKRLIFNELDKLLIFHAINKTSLVRRFECDQTS